MKERLRTIFNDDTISQNSFEDLSVTKARPLDEEEISFIHFHSV